MARTDILLANAHEFVGQEIGLTDWIDVDQMQINVFGEVTRWRTWMHCDVERSKRESPYGGTIVHGFYYVSLLTYFTETGGMDPPDGDYHLNYGLDKVRVLNPVTIGDGVRLRDRIGLLNVVDKGEGRKLCTTSHLFEVEGEAEPAAYAEFLCYWYPKQAPV
jgi:acyl dehydratase